MGMGNAWLSLLLLVLPACATVPEPLRASFPKLLLSDVRNDVQSHLNQKVRWGGRIVDVRNTPAMTLLDIVTYPLDNSARPDDAGENQGRIIVRKHGFLDPAVYRQDREVTVVGTIAGAETRPIGDYPYTYVVLNADVVYLWPPRPERTQYYRDWPYSPFYDPFYDPFSPFGPRWYGPPYRYF
jgi:outer membrane lipoprotein